MEEAQFIDLLMSGDKVNISLAYTIAVGMGLSHTDMAKIVRKHTGILLGAYVNAKAIKKGTKDFLYQCYSAKYYSMENSLLRKQTTEQNIEKHLIYVFSLAEKIVCNNLPFRLPKEIKYVHFTINDTMCIDCKDVKNVLTCLAIHKVDKVVIKSLPAEMRFLDIYKVNEIRFECPLPSTLKELYVAYCKNVVGFPAIPDGVTSIHLYECDFSPDTVLKIPVRFKQNTGAFSFTLAREQRNIPITVKIEYV
jgi:hypothetical protein